VLQCVAVCMTFKDHKDALPHGLDEVRCSVVNYVIGVLQCVAAHYCDKANGPRVHAFDEVCSVLCSAL